MSAAAQVERLVDKRDPQSRFGPTRLHMLVTLAAVRIPRNGRGRRLVGGWTGDPGRISVHSPICDRDLDTYRTPVQTTSTDEPVHEVAAARPHSRRHGLFKIVSDSRFVLGKDFRRLPIVIAISFAMGLLEAGLVLLVVQMAVALADQRQSFDVTFGPVATREVAVSTGAAGGVVLALLLVGCLIPVAILIGRLSARAQATRRATCKSCSPPSPKRRSGPSPSFSVPRLRCVASPPFSWSRSSPRQWWQSWQSFASPSSVCCFDR
jgi:hypothetical protein